MDGLRLFVAALGIAVALEGLPYFVSPRSVREVLAWLLSRPDRALRTYGFGLIGVGVALLLLSRA